MDRELDTTVQAEYADGFVLDEARHGDVNPYGDGNVFTAIVNRQPERNHGPMVRFSCFWAGGRHDIDWTQLSPAARPVRFRHGFASLTNGVQTRGWTGVEFGWETPTMREIRKLGELDAN